MVFDREEYVKKYRETHREEGRAYSREYNRLHKEERKAYQKKWEEQNKDKVKERARVYAREHRQKYLLKNKARRLAEKLDRQPCQVCGLKKVEAHHCDYNKPLDVMWLCRQHHLEWHEKNEAIEPRDKC